jgi:hypothetical protein
MINICDRKYKYIKYIDHILQYYHSAIQSDGGGGGTAQMGHGGGGEDSTTEIDSREATLSIVLIQN